MTESLHRSTTRGLLALAKDRRGTVPMVVAGWLVLVAGVGMLAVEYGRMSVDQRNAQVATKQAAVAAASNLLSAESVAAAAVSNNRLTDNTEMVVVRGRYSHDPMLPKEQRFQPDPLNANAARVTVRAETPLHLGRIFTGSPSYAITAEATAANTAFGAIAIGGRTLSVQDGLTNQILSGLLGARIELGASDYSALVGTRIDLFRYMQALAAEMGLSGGTYDRLVRQTVQGSVALTALAKASRSEHGAETTASQALEAIAAAASRSAGAVRISNLFSPGPYAAHMIDEPPGGPAVSVNALDLLNALAQSASGNRQAEAKVDLRAPGIVGTTVRVGFGERPSSLSWIKIGAEGANIQTAQTRVLLTLKLQGVGAISTLDLPILVEVANASAQLSSIRCNHMQPARSTMHVDARPGTVDAWIGELADFEFANMAAAPRPLPARIVDLPVLRVTGRASAAVHTMHPNTLVFTQSEASMKLVKSVGGREFTSHARRAAAADHAVRDREAGGRRVDPAGADQDDRRDSPDGAALDRTDARQHARRHRRRRRPRRRDAAGHPLRRRRPRAIGRRAAGVRPAGRPPSS